MLVYGSGLKLYSACKGHVICERDLITIQIRVFDGEKQSICKGSL
ncbi:MAG: hypothetical protein JSC188_000769 [Candidatus Tokpelaia sp. JSC188]|nr:MAG: hypothetical protein JSC188_000769 [Candidatus Tokpelaia sp. JSC188]